jgi:hypothetical protein
VARSSGFFWYLIIGWIALLLGIIAFLNAQEVPLVIEIDVKPDSDVNPLNVQAHGKVPAALLCSATFDPLTVDVTSVKLGGATGEHCDLEDVNGDTCIDLICHFPTPAIGVTCESTEVTLTAVTTDGTPLTGTDTVRPVPCKGVTE